MSRKLLSVFLFFLAAASLYGQSSSAGVVCVAASNPPIIHARGIAERVGDIVLTCQGTPSTKVTGNFTIFLNTAVTNKLGSDNTALADVVLTLNAGGADTILNGPARLGATNQVAFNGVDFTVPASSFTLRFSGIRANAQNLGTPFQAQPVTAFAGFTGPSQVAVTNNAFNVGVPANGLFATVLSTLRCSQLGSPLPADFVLNDLLAKGTAFNTARVTEGYATSFHPREPGADTGVRIVSRYGAFPSGARLFVPDAIAGSSTVQPTSAGDFGVAATPGQWAVSAAGSLLLIRVRGADENGAGGTLVWSASMSANPPFGNFGEIDVLNGEAVAVYEVVDANPAAREWALIPTFLGLPASGVANYTATSQELRLGPLSTNQTASTNAPIPRFVSAAPSADCGVVGDCNASYIPRLRVELDQPLSYVAAQGSAHQIRYVRIYNDGSGRMDWGATVQYKNGSGWLRVNPDTGFVRAETIRVDALPQHLTPGLYEATVVFDSGIGGQKSFPVTLRVDAKPVEPNLPAVSEVLHAATFQPGVFVRGSIGTIKGSFAGTQVKVAFDGLPAQILYADARQINFVVPAELGLRQTAQLVVMADGIASLPRQVNLADAAPGVFNGGILNQDNTLNLATAPAAAGSVVQIFATGLLPPEGGTVEAKIHDRTLTSTEYAGAAPGIPGVQQVNLRIPADLGTMSADLVLCNVTGTPVCGPPAKVHVRGQ